jgi:hypothetical protein
LNYFFNLFSLTHGGYWVHGLKLLNWMQFQASLGFRVMILKVLIRFKLTTSRFYYIHHIVPKPIERPQIKDIICYIRHNKIHNILLKNVIESMIFKLNVLASYGHFWK